MNEIKRLVEEGLKKGPDHYINLILYCTKGDRFQEEDGQLINEIMKLYPNPRNIKQLFRIHNS